MRTFESFNDHADIQKYKTIKIGHGLDQPEDITRSHFRNVTDYVEVNIQIHC